MDFLENNVSSLYSVIQSNGQRICFPNSEIRPQSPPSKGREIFVGNLPHNIFEDEIIPIFLQSGPIYKLRLMMDYNSTTRGFAFITYYNEEDAHNAVYIFSGYPIRKGIYLTVQLSVDNRRLFLGNISRIKTAQQIQDRLEQVLEGVVQVYVNDDVTNPKLNRGFAFVEFDTHAHAAIARRQLMVNNAGLFWKRRQRVIVDWAHPEPVVHYNEFKQIKVLHFRNIPIKYPTHCFKECLFEIGESDKIERIYKKDNYAFVHYVDRTSAEAALEKMQSDSLVIWNRVIEVEWARPVTYSRRMRCNESPDNFCLSVPPILRKMIKKSKKEFRKRQLSSTTTDSSGPSSEDNLEVSEQVLRDCFSQMTLF